ncbi:MAG: sugar ABC transporter substrate-binding protein, partial [Firmicutes bacterium]|nr:sugar ABC transporter substrate-binding protein [Candidatus Scybalomonas excrementavium]
MRVKKVLVASLVFAMTMATTLTGCGSKGGEAATTADGKTKIRFASWDTAEDVDRQQELVDKFNA